MLDKINISFGARLVFTNPDTKIKPYVRIHNERNAVSRFRTLKQPSWLFKLLFGIKKNVKLPSAGEQK